MAAIAMLDKYRFIGCRIRFLDGSVWGRIFLGDYVRFLIRHALGGIALGDGRRIRNVDNRSRIFVAAGHKGQGYRNECRGGNMCKHPFHAILLFQSRKLSSRSYSSLAAASTSGNVKLRSNTRALVFEKRESCSILNSIRVEQRQLTTGLSGFIFEST